MQKISCKMDKKFLRYSILFHRGPTMLPPALRFSEKPSPGRVKLCNEKGAVSNYFFQSESMLYKNYLKIMV